MTIASFLTQRRRLLVFCAATVVLHGLAIDWAARSLLASATTRLHAPVVAAQLRVALPRQTDSAPLAEVQPLASAADPQPVPAPVPAPRPAPEARPVLPPRPAPALGDAGSRAITPLADDGPAPIALGDAAVASMMMPALQRGAPAQDGAVAGAQGAEASSGAGHGTPGSDNSGNSGNEAPGAGNVTPIPPAMSATASAPAGQPAAALPEAAPAVRRYKVQLPPSAIFEMDVARVDANGAKWTGAATMTWHTDGSRYQASVEAGVSLLVTRLNLLVLRSAGTIDDHGIAPDKVTEKRARRAETATHFNRHGDAGDGQGQGGARAGTISFSASASSYPLLPGAQDKATVPFQLAGIGRADVNQFGSAIDIQVGEDKTADIFRFQLVGEEELETKLGKLVTWHLTRPPKPGSYSSRLDIWLAPGLQWYPVQIRNTEASGALTTQTIATIKTEESGK